MEVGAQYDGKRIHGERYFNELLENLDEVPTSVRDLLRTTRGGLEMFQEVQKSLLKALMAHDHISERVGCLMSIDGVGEVCALTWALEIDDPTRFSNLKPGCELLRALQRAERIRGQVQEWATLKAAQPAPANPAHRNCQAGTPAQHSTGRPTHRRTRAPQQPQPRHCAIARKLVAYLMAVDKSGQPWEDRTTSR